MKRLWIVAAFSNRWAHHTEHNLIAFWNSNHLGNGGRIETTECLSITQSVKRAQQCPPPAKMIHDLDLPGTHLPQPRLPYETPGPEHPRLCIMKPPKGIEDSAHTHILDRAVWKISIPLILDLLDFAGCLIVEDKNLTGDSLLLANSFDLITGLHV